MGPRNVRIVKAKLREIALALGIPPVASAGVVARQRRRRRQQIHTEQQRNRGERRVRAAGPARGLRTKEATQTQTQRIARFVFAPLLSSARRLAPPAAGPHDPPCSSPFLRFSVCSRFLRTRLATRPRSPGLQPASETIAHESNDGTAPDDVVANPLTAYSSVDSSPPL